MNLGNLYDYVPIRTFANYDDVHNFVTGLNISPWWVFIVFGYVVVFLMWQFFSKTLTSAYLYSPMKTTRQRATLMIISVFIMFWFFGGSAYAYPADPQVAASVSYFLSCASLLAIPGMIIALWSTRLFTIPVENNF